jgi:hypothetical protein
MFKNIHFFEILSYSFDKRKAVLFNIKPINEIDGRNFTSVAKFVEKV